MGDIFYGFDVVVWEIEDFEIDEVFEALDLEEAIVIEFEFDEIGAEIKADDFLDEIVSEIKGCDVGWIDCMLFDGSDSASDVIDFLYLMIRSTSSYGSTSQGYYPRVYKIMAFY